MAITESTLEGDLASRMRTLRRMIAGENQTAFAAKMEIELKRWNNFERGSPLSKEVAFLLVQKVPGLTLDWLYFGKVEGLTVALRDRLEEAGKATKSADRRGR